MKRIERHALIPKHIKLSEKEKKELLEKYNISIARLPRISKRDAGIATLGAKRGDIIKIIRHSSTAGESFFYRVVA